MANEEHLARLMQGVEVWNLWRQGHPEIEPDLHEADLVGAHLNGAYLSFVDLNMADLTGADLTGAYLKWADLSGADLVGADLSDAVLHKADLSDADLSDAVLYKADLSDAELIGANLRGADLSKAQMFQTVLNNLDLRQVKGLETVDHAGPSYIDIQTIYRSQGEIPEIFLWGAGVPNSFIEYMRSLIGKPIDYYSAFISYSSKDEEFARRLYNDLQGAGVRCWYAPEDMKIGDEIRPRIEESIRLYDKLLLVLSTHSVASTWVAYEVKRALNKEPEGIPNVLFPVRLDDAVLDSKVGWAEDIRRTRHIGDFTYWKDHDAYQHAFARLLRDLKADPALPPEPDKE